MARACGVGLLAAALVGLASVRAQGRAPSADEVKAAYIHKLPGYVEWPAGAFGSDQAPLVIGVIGDTEVVGHLEHAAAMRAAGAAGRPVVVKRLKRLAPDDGLHILFASADAWPAVARELAVYAGRSVLILAESAGALNDGAMLNFVLHDGRVRFELAPGVAQAHGLKLSSRLMAVAQRLARPGP